MARCRRCPSSRLALVMGMRARLALAGPPRNGEDVIAAYRTTVEDIVG